jgi:hypothetical protein
VHSITSSDKGGDVDQLEGSVRGAGLLVVSEKHCFLKTTTTSSSSGSKRMMSLEEELMNRRSKATAMDVQAARQREIGPENDQRVTTQMKIFLLAIVFLFRSEKEAYEQARFGTFAYISSPFLCPYRVDSRNWPREKVQGEKL